MPKYDEFGRREEDTRTKDSRYFDPHREKYDPNRGQFGLTALGRSLGMIPGLALAGARFDGQIDGKTYAPSPIRKDSTTGRVKFLPVDHDEAWKWYRQARSWLRDRGELMRQYHVSWCKTVAVLECFLSDYLDYKTGRLDPSHIGIAKKTSSSARQVARVLALLQALQIIHRIRRCSHEDNGDGKLVWRQERNAYFVLSPGNWFGFRAPKEPPTPERETWGGVEIGAHDPLIEAVTVAQEHRKDDQPPDMAQTVDILSQAEPDSLAAAFANWGKAMLEKGFPSDILPDCHDGSETTPLDSLIKEN